MVSFIFKYTEKGEVQFPLSKPAQLDSALQQCVTEADIRLGDYIAVRNGTVVPAASLIEDGDKIDIFPALSGG